MTSPLQLTERDEEILCALAQKVRLFSQRQIADFWWHGELPNAKRRLRRLAGCDLITRVTVRSRPLPTLQSPIITWQPGSTPPNFSAAAYQCQQRWRHCPVRSCAAWIASERCAQAFGGVRRGELYQSTQATHDLGVSAVWMRIKEIDETWADAWRSEDLFAHTRVGEKLPDAFLVDSNNRVLWVLEFGGGYDTQRVSEFHTDCANRNLPYQLW